MIDVRIIIVGILIAGMIMGYQYGIYSKDCRQDYNRGYGDALYFALEHQKMQMKMDREWEFHPNNSIRNYTYNTSGYNVTWYFGSVNMTMNLTNINTTSMNFSNCRQNETGHNASDLVMHITC